MPNDLLLHAESLSIRSDDALLVDDINFRIGRERVALVGESGSGKSLTARSLMGLLSPALHLHAQKLEVAGHDALRLSEKAWSALRGDTVAMVMQDPKYALNPTRTIGWQVEEPLLLHRRLSRSERKEKVCEMLDAVGLPQPRQLMQRYPHQLSGGMGQRVMLAIALITDPDLLIADELMRIALHQLARIGQAHRVQHLAHFLFALGAAQLAVQHQRLFNLPADSAGGVQCVFWILHHHRDFAAAQGDPVTFAQVERIGTHHL